MYFWVGDVIGIATTTPFLLIHGARIARGVRPRITLEGVLQTASIALVLALISELEPGRAANLFYVLFMPLVWISTRYGFEGATAGLLATQLGLIAAVQLAGYTTEWVLQFQLLMLALTVTAAFLGMSATQWRRARRALESREAELKTIFATAPDGIVTLDEHYRVTGANNAAEAMFGLKADELNGMQSAAAHSRSSGRPFVRARGPCPGAARGRRAAHRDLVREHRYRQSAGLHRRHARCRRS